MTALTDDDVTRCARGCGGWKVKGTECRTCQIIEADRTLEAWRAKLPKMPKHTVQARLEAWWAA